MNEAKKCNGCGEFYFDCGQEKCPHCGKDDISLENIFNEGSDIFGKFFGDK